MLNWRDALDCSLMQNPNEEKIPDATAVKCLAYLPKLNWEFMPPATELISIDPIRRPTWTTPCIFVSNALPPIYTGNDSAMSRRRIIFSPLSHFLEPRG